MMLIFIEYFLEVFIYDFTLFSEDIDSYLYNLEVVLKRYVDTHLVLNYKKCHSIVSDGIVFGHKVSPEGIKVDKVKVDIISRLSPPILVKGIRIFWGHSSFYR